MLIVTSAASTLDDEFERDREDVLLVEIAVLTAPRAASTLDEELDKLFELVLIAVRSASTLDEENETFTDEV